MKKPNKIKQWIQKTVVKSLFSASYDRGWVPIVNESFLGAYQINAPLNLSDYLAHPTVFACITQIAFDIGKLRLDIGKTDKDDIFSVYSIQPFSTMLKKPNKYQIRQKFIESWIISLLTYGNTYVLKGRDANNKVNQLHVLDPNKIEPLISENGDVFYRVKKDRLSNIQIDIDAVPAYEIIHDTYITLYHPLVGVSPIYAADLATQQGLAIQNHSANFFENKARPGGILTAPGHIKKEVADRIRTLWTESYTGTNAGKIAVLGDGLKYEQMSETAADSELIGQLNWSDEKICSAFKVPPYKVHVGKPPTYEQSETLDRKYYSDCLQSRIEAIEALLDDGLNIPGGFETQFNVEDLMRMDMSLKMRTAVEGVKGGILTPNEGRKKFNLKPKIGGDTPYMQQQNYSLEALNERDKNNPLSVIPIAEPEPEPDNDENDKVKVWRESFKYKADLVEVLK